MGIIVQSQKWFNELRNGLNFSQNLTDYTDSMRGNAGERVKVEMDLIVTGEEIEFGSGFPVTEVDVRSVGFGGTGDFELVLNGSSSFILPSWSGLGFSEGDFIQIYDTASMSVVAEGTINYIGGFGANTNLANMTQTSPPTLGASFGGFIRNASPIYDFQFNYNLFARSTSPQSASNQEYLRQGWFEIPRLEYVFNKVGEPSPVVRDTNFVTGFANGSKNWDSGTARMRYVEDINGNPITQRYILEHTFIIQRITDETFLTGANGSFDPLNPSPPSFAYLWGTLDYQFQLYRNPDIAGNPNVLLGENIYSGLVGWFNENFDSGQLNTINNYSLVSTSYEDLGIGQPTNQIQFNSVTRVTHVIDGVNFALGQKVNVHHTKIPSKAEREQSIKDYTTIWVDDVHQNTIGAVSSSGTIIKNLSINLNSPTQIEVQYDLDFAETEEIFDGDECLLYVTLEDDNLDPLLANRVNLLTGFTTYFVTTDEADLFFLDEYRIYDHTKTLDVDQFSTDFEGYIEDGVLLDMRFRLKNDEFPEFGNDRDKWSNFQFYLIAYNLNDDSFFKITRSERFTSGREKSLDGLWKYSNEWLNTWKNYDFKLLNESQFNKAHTDSPTFASDIEYISNDGTYGFYRALIGIKVDWQQIIKLDENSAETRVGNPEIDKYFEQVLGVSNDYTLGDVYDFALFTDTTQVHNGYNRKIDKYREGDWIIRPALQIIRDNQTNTEDTYFFNFMPEWKPYDYDTNSDYTGDIKTFDSNDNDLNGSILQNEETKVVVTFDDGNIKSDINKFEGIIRIEVKNQAGYDIYEMSSFRDPLDSSLNLLLPFNGDYAEKTIVNDKYTLTCLIDGEKLTAPTYKITGRIFDLEQPYDPNLDDDLSGWYDATGLIAGTSNAYGIVAPTGEVSVWKNLKADSNYDLFQLLVAKQPLFDVVKSQVVFSFPNDFLYWTGNDLGSQFSIFAVVESKATGGSKSLMHYNRGDNNTPFDDYVGLYDDTPNAINPRLRADSGQSAVTTQMIESPLTRLDSTKSIRQLSCNFGGDWYMKINNVRIDTPDDIQNTPNIVDPIFGIGAFIKSNGVVVESQDARDGFFHEILIFANQDVSTKEEGIYTYLATKWGV